MSAILNRFGCARTYAIVVFPLSNLPLPFPVALAFFRQLPFLGQSTSLSYIRPVHRAPSHCTLAISPTSPPRAPVCEPFSRLTYVCGMTDTPPIYWNFVLPDRTAAFVSSFAPEL
ncbi:hypothetical protein BJV78DRAFT_611026 [Lactifluus subvellereus]|nr:hypothetical protein BJV78DRAFT_611026 [Lactifluus subvellereus]